MNENRYFLCITCSYPNNPDGTKKAPLVKDPDHVITDMVYYWPMFTDIDKKMDDALMVFSRYIICVLKGAGGPSAYARLRGGRVFVSAS